MITVLARIGLVRVTDKGVRWPVRIAPWHLWRIYLRRWPWDTSWPYGAWIGFFRNLPGFKKWEKGRLLPSRWGIRIIGIEIGDRGWP